MGVDPTAVKPVLRNFATLTRCTRLLSWRCSVLLHMTIRCCPLTTQLGTAWSACMPLSWSAHGRFFLDSEHLLGMSITRTAPAMTWTLRHLPLPTLTAQLLLRLSSRLAATGLQQGQVLPPGLQVTRLTFLCTLTPTLT